MRKGITQDDHRYNDGGPLSRLRKSRLLDLLTLLRQRTRAAHERLDAALDFASPGTMDWSGYCALLRASLDVVAPLEEALGAWELAAAKPSRVACLRHDLAALGQPASPRFAAVPRPRTQAEAYGCAYVLEGSTLGGLVVASFVRRDLGPHAAVTYLTLRGTATRNAWQSFVRELRDFGNGCTAGDCQAAAAIAADTFDAYAASFARAGLLPVVLQ